MVKVKNMCQAKTLKEIRLLNYSIMGESSIPAAQLKAGLHPAETLSSISKIPSVLFETHGKQFPYVTDSQLNQALLLCHQHLAPAALSRRKEGANLTLRG